MAFVHHRLSNQATCVIQMDMLSRSKHSWSTHLWNVWRSLLRRHAARAIESFNSIDNSSRECNALGHGVLQMYKHLSCRGVIKNTVCLPEPCTDLCLARRRLFDPTELHRKTLRYQVDDRLILYSAGRRPSQRFGKACLC
jgi:hypothetical protein